MMFKSGYNLKNGTSNFVEDSNEITLFSAYIKLEQLKELNTKKNIQHIVVRWEVQDLCLGVSDIELYDYCKEQGITLYRNTRIHLKAIWDNQDSLFFGSANITGKGIGEKGNYNYELNGLYRNLSLEDKLYFKEIIKNSEVVDEELYQKLKSLKEEYKVKKVDYPEVSTKVKSQDKFLLSQLPMSESPELLINGFFNRDSLSKKDEVCLIHDLATYNLNLNFDKVSMETQLRERFNSHPFIESLKQYIKSRDGQSLNYGGVVRWVQDNTTSVPTPRSWEMKKEKIVNILYEWICYFDNKFFWNIPGAKSQVINFKI